MSDLLRNLELHMGWTWSKASLLSLSLGFLTHCAPSKSQDAGPAPLDAGGSGSPSGSSGGASSQAPSSSTSSAAPRDAGPALPGLCLAGPSDAGSADVENCAVRASPLPPTVLAWQRGGANTVWTQNADGGWSGAVTTVEPFDRVAVWLPASDLAVMESSLGARLVRISDGTLLTEFLDPGWRYRGFAITPPNGLGDPWLCVFGADTDLADATLQMSCVTPGAGGGIEQRRVPLGVGQLRFGAAFGTVSGHMVFVVRRQDGDGGLHDELLRQSPLLGYADLVLEADDYLRGSFDDWQSYLVSGVTHPRRDGGAAGGGVMVSDLSGNLLLASRDGTLASGPWLDAEGAFSVDHGSVVVVDPDNTVRAWQTLGGGFGTVDLGFAGATVRAVDARGGAAVVGMRPITTAVVLVDSSTGAVRRVVDDRDCTLGGTEVHARVLGLDAWGLDVFLQRSELTDAGELPRGLNLSRGNGCRLDFPDGRLSTNSPRLFTAASATGRGVYLWTADQGSIEFITNLPHPDMEVFLVGAGR